MTIEKRLILTMSLALLATACGDDSPVIAQPPSLGGAALQVVGTRRFGTAPSTFTKVPSRGVLLVSDAGAPFVNVFDLDRDRIGLIRIEETERTAGLAVSDQLLFVAGVDGSQVFVYDIGTGIPRRQPLFVGQSANLVSVSPDGRYVLCTAFDQPGFLRVFDAAFDFDLAQTLVLGDSPSDMVVAGGSNRQFAYIMGRDRGKLFRVEYGLTTSVSDSLVTDPGGAFIVLSPDRRRLYATNEITSSVYIINLDTMSLEQRVSVGEGPLGLDVSPDGRWLVVASVGSDTVSLIDTERAIAIHELTLGSGADSNPIDVAFVGSRTVYVTLQNEPGIAIVRVTEP